MSVSINKSSRKVHTIMGKKEKRMARKAERERLAADEEEKQRKIFLEIAKETCRLLEQMYFEEVDTYINDEVISEVERDGRER